MEYSKEKKLGIFAIIIIAILALHFNRAEKRTILELRIKQLEADYFNTMVMLNEFKNQFFVEVSMADKIRATNQLRFIKANSEMIKRRKKAIYKRYGF